MRGFARYRVKLFHLLLQFVVYVGRTSIWPDYFRIGTSVANHTASGRLRVRSREGK
jgi:hypothetical protein